MRFIFRYMKKYSKSIAAGMSLKFLGTMTELMLPYILEHMIDNVVPMGKVSLIFLWGFLMVGVAVVCWRLNVMSNRNAVKNAHFVSYDVRRDLFNRTANLSGRQFDEYGLPSLISRMTSDSYNVQSCAQSLQTLCVRAPIMMIGGVIVTLTMDRALALILCVMLPILIAVVLFVSWKGIPLYLKVQDRLDDVVRVMRENITGIRVVKALSKTEYEKRRFHAGSDALMRQDVKAGTVMAVPGPFMQTCLNVGLTLVVFVGAVRVNGGLMKPGVILAFLTYFNLITQSVMALNRIFMMMSKASASADRIAYVLAAEEEQRVLAPEEGAEYEEREIGEDFIRFQHVNFRYQCAAEEGPQEANGREEAPKENRTRNGSVVEGMDAFEETPKENRARDGSVMEGMDALEEAPKENRAKNGSVVETMDAFAGEQQEKVLYDIDFSIKRGESLGIIGPTGCGKTTIVNLLMRFYDVEDGAIFVDGRDVRTYEKDELHRKFGVVFQNDILFNDTLRSNIMFGRPVGETEVESAVEDAMAKEFVDGLDDGLEHMADIKGANLSGGQRQRILIARALAANPEILILDDSSSALDYKTDAALRKAISAHHKESTTIMIAQRVSSVQNMTNILVMDNGHCIGYGNHQHLLENCPTYREIYQTQMGEV